MFVDPSGRSYEQVIQALDSIYDVKVVMVNTERGSYIYKKAYEQAMRSKEIIRNSDIYIEDWGGLTGILSIIVEGDSNSLDSIAYTKEVVSKAKEKSEGEDLRDDVLFISGIVAVIAPVIKGGVSWIQGLGSIGGETVINFAPAAAQHMQEAARYVPESILQYAIKFGTANPDPQGSTAIMYKIQMYRNNVAYTLEVLYDHASNTIYHFKYYR